MFFAGPYQTLAAHGIGGTARVTAYASPARMQQKQKTAAEAARRLRVTRVAAA
jgi:hypothetical protein